MITKDCQVPKVNKLTVPAWMNEDPAAPRYGEKGFYCRDEGAQPEAPKEPREHMDEMARVCLFVFKKKSEAGGRKAKPLRQRGLGLLGGVRSSDRSRL